MELTKRFQALADATHETLDQQYLRIQRGQKTSLESVKHNGKTGFRRIHGS